MDDKFKITVKIVGKAYEVSINRSDEEKYRRAEREVNGLVSMYKDRYRVPDNDLLAMTALQAMVLKVSAEIKREIGDDLGTLNEIERTLDSCIDKF